MPATHTHTHTDFKVVPPSWQPPSFFCCLKSFIFHCLHFKLCSHPVWTLSKILKQTFWRCSRRSCRGLAGTLDVSPAGFMLAFTTEVIDLTDWLIVIDGIINHIIKQHGCIDTLRGTDWSTESPHTYETPSAT